MATSATPIPMPMTPVVNPKTGFASTEWYRYWSSPLIPDLSLAGVTTDNLAQGSKNLYFSNLLSYNATKQELIAGPGISITFNDLSESITISSFVTSLLGTDSISVVGSTSTGNWSISLVNDAPSPGSYMGYGTNVNGVKGWFPSPDLFQVLAYQ